MFGGRYVEGSGQYSKKKRKKKCHRSEYLLTAVQKHGQLSFCIYIHNDVTIFSIWQVAYL